MWIAGARPKDPGTLSRYAVDEAGAIDLDEPMLDEAEALAGFSLRGGRLAWDGAGRGR